GTLGQEYNYHLGFGAAAVGMFLGLVVYVVTRKKYLGLAGDYVPNPIPKEKKKKVYSQIAIGIVVILALVIILSMAGILTINGIYFIVIIFVIMFPTIFIILMIQRS